MTDEELVQAFERGTLPAAAFTHAAHVRVAWWYLGRYGLGGAITRFSAALRRFATQHGAPGKYHQTVTVAHLLIIDERRHRDSSASWDTFAAANPDPSRASRRCCHSTTRTKCCTPSARAVFLMPAGSAF